MSYAPCEVPRPRQPVVVTSRVTSLGLKRVISLAQFVLVVSNTLSLLPGLFFLGLGVMFLLLQRSILPLLPFTVNLFVAPLVAMGVLAYLVSVLGYCSVWKHWRSLLIMYSMGMVALMATQGYLAAATASWGQMRNVQTLTSNWLTEKFNNNETRKSFELLEFMVPCCGSYGVQSYRDLGLQLPESCCEEGTVSNGSCSGAAYPGCAGLVSRRLQSAANVLGSTFFYLMAVELLALIASIFLFRNAPVRVTEPLYRIVNREEPRDQAETHELVTSQPQRRPSD